VLVIVTGAFIFGMGIFLCKASKGVYSIGVSNPYDETHQVWIPENSIVLKEEQEFEKINSRCKLLMINGSMDLKIEDFKTFSSGKNIYIRVFQYSPSCQGPGVRYYEIRNDVGMMTTQTFPQRKDAGPLYPKSVILLGDRLSIKWGDPGIFDRIFFVSFWIAGTLICLFIFIAIYCFVYRLLKSISPWKKDAVDQNGS